MNQNRNPEPEKKPRAWIVFTGGPGVGKTTLIEELSRRGLPHREEVARNIIKEQVASNGEALPWGNRQAYAELMLSRSVADYLAAEKTYDANSPLFFDRGIPDVLSYIRLCGLESFAELTPAIEKFRYHPKVFILPPWKEIYTTDTERKQTFEEAVATDRQLRQAYRDCEYEIVIVPLLSVAARADFVLSELQKS